MKKYVIDTNVLYGIIFDDGRCNVSRVLELLNENVGIITYATLFEAFNKFKSDKAYIYDIMKILTRYKIEVADIVENKEDKELFGQLVYKETELSEKEIDDLGELLNKQVCKYVSRFLGQLMNSFAFMYTKMKLNKEDDAYNAYVSWSSYETDNFSHFPSHVTDALERIFMYSYSDEQSKKFSDFLQREFWGIIRVVETHYRTLEGKPVEYIQENDFSKELDNVIEEFDKEYTEKNYLDFIKRTYEEMGNGNKKLASDHDLFAVIDAQLLKPLEKDFLFYCLKRMFLNQGKFKYNDIIDFINLSTAFNLEEVDGIMILDKKFWKVISGFDCIQDTDFYETSMQINKYILDEK